MREHKYTTQAEIDFMKEELKTAKSTYNNGKYRCVRVLRFSICLVLFILLTSVFVSVIITKNSGQTPQILGYQFYRVKSGSMSPTLKVGSVILSKKPKDPSSLKVGDIISFNSNRTIITHRIIEVVSNNGISYRTKGDNPANTPDIDLLLPKDVKAVFVLKLY